MIIGTWGSNKNFWGGGRIPAVTRRTHLKYYSRVPNNRPGTAINFSGKFPPGRTLLGTGRLLFFYKFSPQDAYLEQDAY